jgi:YidC/Oxa1 family membrane protein insertase
MPGWQEFVIDPLTGLVTAIAGGVGGYAIAIILVTLAIRLLLLPLTMKGMRAQRKMQTVQPKLQAVKAQARGNKQREQQMTMELYKKEGVNPLAGCLPMLLQMPVWLAMYGALLTLGNCVIPGSDAISVGRTAANAVADCAANGGNILLDENFLWFNLALPDATFDLPFVADTVPFAYISVMAILSGAVFFLQTYMTPLPSTAGSTGFAASMQSAMKFMPVFFMFIGWMFFSAFLLYWVWTGLIQVVQQFFFSGLGKLEDRLSPGTVRFLISLGAGRFAGVTPSGTIELDADEFEIDEPSTEKPKTKKRRRRRRRKRGRRS